MFALYDSRWWIPVAFVIAKSIACPLRLYDYDSDKRWYGDQSSDNGIVHDSAGLNVCNQVTRHHAVTAGRNISTFCRERVPRRPIICDWNPNIFGRNFGSRPYVFGAVKIFWSTALAPHQSTTLLITSLDGGGRVGIPINQLANFI